MPKRAMRSAMYESESRQNRRATEWSTGACWALSKGFLLIDSRTQSGTFLHLVSVEVDQLPESPVCGEFEIEFAPFFRHLVMQAGPSEVKKQFLQKTSTCLWCETSRHQRFASIRWGRRAGHSPGLKKPLIRSALYGVSSLFSLPPSRFTTPRDGRSGRGAGASTRSNPQAAQDHDEERLGLGRPDQGGISVFARTRPRRGGTRGADLSSWRSGRSHAQSCGRGRHARGLAEGGRDTGQTRGQAHSDLCLWRLLPGSWRNRGRSQQLRSKVRKSHNLCFSRGVGRQSDYRIVARSSAISPGPEWANGGLANDSPTRALFENAADHRWRRSLWENRCRRLQHLRRARLRRSRAGGGTSSTS